MPESDKNSFIHPYIPNSAPEIKKVMLKKIGVKNVEELYKEIPDRLKFKGRLNIPDPILSEYELKKEIEKILSKNKDCNDYLNFLGGGCWQHYVPAVCDEIVSRAEFLTAYAADVYSDLGKYQAFFEYQSQLGELVGMDVVCLPVYSWGAAAGFSFRMASRIVERNEVLVPEFICPERLSTIINLCNSADSKTSIVIKKLNQDSISGQINLDDLRTKISSNTAAVYFENPSYLGILETQGKSISEISSKKGALVIVGVDPISLGVIEPPSNYGADIVVGTIQPLGVHMNFGGGECGFIATRDDEIFVSENPSLLISITDTVKPGEYGFGHCTYERTSYLSRDEGGNIVEKSKDFTGTISNLWAIAASVYMSLMGPHGFKEIGDTIIEKTLFAKQLISKLPGIKLLFDSYNFKEFVVNFNNTGKTVKEINHSLLKNKIFGGKDISKEFPELGESALYCITEVHSQENIEYLAKSLEEVLK